METSNISRPWLTKEEFAELTGIAESTVTRLCLKGEIPSRKFGRARRIPASYLNQDQEGTGNEMGL